MKNPYIRDLVRKNVKRNMGTLPTIIAELIDVLNNPWSSAGDLARIISVDPVLSSRLLRMVNSAYYGLINDIVDIKQAIAMVGFNAVRTLAFCMTIFDNFFELNQKESFNKEQFWIHCLATGMTAKYIAIELKLENPGGYFLAGLLHDIGKIFLYQFMVRDFYRVLGLAQTRGLAFFEAEKIILETNHAEIGKYIMKQWKLPEALVKTIYYHHTPVMDKTKFSFSDIILISDTYSKANRIGFGGDEVISPFYSMLKKKYGLTDKYLEGVSDRIKEEVDQFSQVIRGTKNKIALSN